jgi:hypothetical protein
MTADARFWNDIADKYSRKPVEDPAAFERKIATTKGRMTRESVVLDIGCGTGSLALRLADSGRHLPYRRVRRLVHRIRTGEPRRDLRLQLAASRREPTGDPGPHLPPAQARGLLHLVHRLPRAVLDPLSPDPGRDALDRKGANGEVVLARDARLRDREGRFRRGGRDRRRRGFDDRVRRLDEAWGALTRTPSRRSAIGERKLALT